MTIVTRHSFNLSGWRSVRSCQSIGFTIPEIMVTAAIIGIVSSISIIESGNAYNRDRLNQASLLLKGWLLELANQPDKVGQSCAVTISTGAITTGGQIASVSPSTCSNSPVLRMPGDFSSLKFNVGATNTTWSFTRRNAIDSTNDVIIKFSLNGYTALRCVRVQALSGLLRLGRNKATSDVTATCDNWNTI